MRLAMVMALGLKVGRGGSVSIMEYLEDAYMWGCQRPAIVAMESEK